MKRFLLFCLILIIIVGVTTPLLSLANDGAEVASPSVTTSPAPEESASPAPTHKVTQAPIDPNKGNVVVVDPGDKDGPTNSTGQIIFVLAIVLVCLFFVLEGIFSLFVKKKKK